MILSCCLSGLQLVAVTNWRIGSLSSGAYKRSTLTLNSEERARRDATDVCHFWYFDARIAANVSVNRVGAGRTHLVAPGKQVNSKEFFHTTVGKSRQIRHSHKRRRFRTKPHHWIVIGRARQAPLSVEAERVLEGIVPGWNARLNWRDGGACPTARVGYWTPRDNASYRHCQGLGWLWLGLASGTRSLKSVARHVGSGALRPQPSLRRPQRQLGRSLRQFGTAIRRMATLRRLARPILRLAPTPVRGS